MKLRDKFEDLKYNLLKIQYTCSHILVHHTSLPRERFEKWIAQSQNGENRAMKNSEMVGHRRGTQVDQVAATSRGRLHLLLDAATTWLKLVSLVPGVLHLQAPHVGMIGK